MLIFASDKFEKFVELVFIAIDQILQRHYKVIAIYFSSSNVIF